MKKIKSIKDTIHGYIEFDEPYWRLIDSPEFQRLKWIEQTSYRILYPSARHDRFIHSLGVFHLGKIAFDSFLQNTKKFKGELSFNKAIGDKKLSSIKNSFLFSCLFHDVGHAPFSHTLENLFSSGSIRKKDNVINSLLLTTINESNHFADEEKKDFTIDYEYILENSKDSTGMSILSPPKAHEIVSSILIAKRIDSFCVDKDYLETLSLDLCLRAIMGITYRVKSSFSENKKLELGFKNGVIRLLNSNTIDVDKLDYIKRDTIMSGYDNTSIDTVRLLKSLTFIEKDGVFYPAFNKSALSIIDNVIKAKNAQAKWIIAHPAVMYEEYLVTQIIDTIIEKYVQKYCVNSSGAQSSSCPNDVCKPNDKCEQYLCKYSNKDAVIRKLFSVDALTINGVTILGNQFCLLSDNDIICMMKEFINTPHVSEFFARNKRFKPIWKSPEEFIYLFKTDKFNKITEISKFFKAIFQVFPFSEEKSVVVNMELYERVRKEVDNGNDDFKQALSTLQFMKDYCDEQNFDDFEFVIIPAKNSFSTKVNEESTYFVFDSDNNKYAKYSDVFMKETDTNDTANFEFIYIYIKQEIDRNTFIDKLYSYFKVGFSYA